MSNPTDSQDRPPFLQRLLFPGLCQLEAEVAVLRREIDTQFTARDEEIRALATQVYGEIRALSAQIYGVGDDDMEPAAPAETKAEPGES